MLTDRYDLPLSTDSSAARDAYLLGVDAVLGAMPGPVQHLTRAVEADAGFALAWAALARARFLEADVAGAREATARARALAQGVTERETGHVNAIALAIEGRPVDALAATREHLDRCPRDAMVLAPATGVFGLIGFSGRQEREAELEAWLQALSSSYGNDWWFGTVLAFAECETGQLEAALDRIERSLAACPGNAHGAHVMAHVRYERGEPGRAAAFLDDWLPGYRRSGLMHCHLSWHAALSALALGLPEKAWAIYREAVHPGASWGPPLNAVTDAPSFLWRAELAGQARRADLWAQAQAYAIEKFPKVGVTFADVHVALACAAVGDGAALRRMTDELQQRLAAGRLPAGEVVPRLVQGFAAFARGDWDVAIAAFEAGLAQLVRIGGSRAQRDLVEDTLIAACLRTGQTARARQLLERRVDRRPLTVVAGLDRPSPLA